MNEKGTLRKYTLKAKYFFWNKGNDCGNFLVTAFAST